MPDSAWVAPLVPSLRGTAKAATLVADPVNSATGSFTHHETDMPEAASSGLNLERWYNSSDSRVTVLGAGWSPAWSDRLVPDGAGGYTFSDSSGRVTTFAPNGGGGWTHPVGADAVLSWPGPGNSPTLYWQNGDQWVFDEASGALAQTVLADTRTIVAGRDSDGDVVTLTASTGVAETFTYGPTPGGKRLASVSSSLGPTASYSYGSAGELISATSNGSVTTTYGYDTAGLLATVTDPSGVPIVRNVYNDAQQVTSQTSSNGSVTTFSYDGYYQSTTVHDPVTNTDLTYTHDSHGRATSIADPYGKIATIGYDGQNNVLSSIDRANVKRTLGYDSNNNFWYEQIGSSLTVQNVYVFKSFRPEGF